MPPLRAVCIDPGHLVVVLGQLSPEQRTRLATELRAALLPQGAPHAGLGGASSADGLNRGWVATGAVFLALAGVAGLAYWRRRDVS